MTLKKQAARYRAQRETYTTQEILDLLGVSEATFTGARDRGELPFRGIRIGRVWRYPRRAVDLWIAGLSGSATGRSADGA